MSRNLLHALGLALTLPLALSATSARVSAVDDVAEPSSPIDGTVLDTSGGAIANATVILRLPTGPERQTRTDAAGRFVFAGVPEGPGTVTVLFDRFSPITVDSRRTMTSVSG